MKIKTIKIKNFKSIKEIEINCNEGINTFIGKNGTGKSAVFDAVNFLIGDGSYPSLNTFNKEWYIEGKEKECVIEIQTSDGTIKFDTRKSNPTSYCYSGNNKEYNLSNEIKDKIKINFLPSNRTIKSIMPTNGWSLLGKYFYNESFFGEEVKVFHTLMQNAKEQLKKNSKFSEFLNTITNELSSQIGRKIEADSEIYDIKHFLKGLEFFTKKDEQKINLINEGSGIQNSFIIACLRALATHRGTSDNPIFIDEPELYLHPHAKKSLYNTLRKLSEPIVDENGVCISDGIQIFYITHSSEFLSYENSEQIYRFYIDGNNGTKNAKGGRSNGLTLRQQMIEPDKISFNNAFFADTVFLVEGYTDEIFLRYIFQNKNPSKAIEDFNISIVNCSSKDNIVRFYNLYNALGVACYTLYDKDSTLPTKDKKGAEYTKDDMTAKQNQRNNNNAELIKCNGYGFEENLEYFLTGDLKHHVENDDKRKIVENWIESSDNNKQQKIDTIWAWLENSCK